MKIVGNYVTETDVAMELCKKVQVEEYAIHVVGSTNSYTHLQFSLLASTWFPRPLGVCLWSALHMLLVLYESLMLLILFPTVFVLAVLWDVFMVASFIYVVLLFPFMVLAVFLGIIIGVALAWLWLVITCQCCILPGRAPGQGLGQYIFTAGGTTGRRDPQPAPGQGLGRYVLTAGGFLWQDPQPAPVMEGGAAAAHGPCGFLRRCCRATFTLRFVRHVIQVSFPYRRAQLGDLCREIVPWCDTIVV